MNIRRASVVFSCIGYCVDMDGNRPKYRSKHLAYMQDKFNRLSKLVLD